MPPLSKEQLEILAEKRLKGTLSTGEFRLLEEWYNREAQDPVYWDSQDTSERELRERLYAAIRADAGIETARVIPLRKSLKRWAVAAAVLILAAGGYAVYRSLPKNEAVADEVYDKKRGNEVPPGFTGAVLTLADGSKIALDSTGTGRLATQGSSVISRTGGMVSYSGKATAQALYNTMTTPRGQQSPPLTLSDGTKIWLNAASSIRFPVAFPGGKRVVEITGEAYLEVAADPSAPFIVKAGGREVKVLGTRFDVEAYTDEPAIKTTLLEGAVSVDNLRLRPGQQARMADNGSPQLINEANVEEVMAWHNGLFEYDDAPVQQVLRQFSRWYNVDVVYKRIPTTHLAGVLSRNTALSQAIKILQNNGVGCRIEGSRLIIE
jgi:ferric-dicitrate binding protein FerR (iron transport regulator)